MRQLIQTINNKNYKIAIQVKIQAEELPVNKTKIYLQR